MKLLLLCIYISFIKLTFGVCPSGFTHCGREHSYSCTTTPAGTSGLLSYGERGRYSLTPFTKPNGRSMRIECDNDHGDIIPGVVKHCCYKITGNIAGIPTSGYAGYLPENGGGWQHWNAFDLQRYGVDNFYVYRVMTHAVGWCNNAFFNDPYWGKAKHCNYKNQPPSTLNGVHWIYCGNEGGDCGNLQGGNRFQWVRYGEHGRYYYRLVTANDRRIPCNNNFFEDPAVGVPKRCWRSAQTWVYDAEPLLDQPPTDDIDNEPNDFNNDINNYTPPDHIRYESWYWLMSHISNSPFYAFLLICTFILYLLIHCSCMVYKVCKKRGRKEKFRYTSVKIADSESEVDSEVNPINVAQ